VVVTSDREIQAWAQGAGAAWINAAQFERQYLLDREPETGEEPEESRDHHLKKGPARRLPKDQRRRQQRLKKL
jgi:predicted RNA-binding protein with PIN domain